MFHSLVFVILLSLIVLLVLVSYPVAEQPLSGQAISVVSQAPLASVCYDNDFGRYYATHGKVLFDDMVHEDTCLSLDTVREYDCVSGRMMAVDHHCKGPCFDGACV